MYWMGIDVGTGGTRALLVDEKGEVRHGFTSPHEEMRMERPLWAEQRPENWWDAAQAAIRGVLAEAKATGASIRGVGLSGQMHGLTMLDGAGQVIRPALIWCDQRSQPQVDALNAKIGPAKIVEAIANPMLTGFTLPKLLWVRDHDPSSFEKLKQMLLPKDYLRYCLTGEYASDVSDASGTGLLDVMGRKWSGVMVSGAGLDKATLPRVVESQEVTGKVSAKAAALTGLAEGTPVVGGGGDQAASAVGNGIVREGIASCTIGTSGVVFVHIEKPVYDPAGRVHTFCHAVPGKWHVMGVTQGAGLSLQWMRNRLAPGVEYSELSKEAAGSPAGSQGLFWLPYLMGERTPHLDALARGGWIGLTAKHTRADLIRSVMEGVAYSQKDCLNLIEGLGVKVASVRLSGGGARSAFWKRIFTDVFDRTVATLETQEGSAYGAALLGMVGTGAFASVEEACRASIKESERLEPNAEAVAVYASTYKVFNELYPALKPLFPKMST